MCITAALTAAGVGAGASIYHSRKQRAATREAAKEARKASGMAQAVESSQRNIAGAEEAAEQQLPDMDDMSVAKRRRGVAGTYLNQTLGE